MCARVIIGFVASVCLVWPVLAAEPTKVTTRPLRDSVIYPEARLAAVAQPLNDTRLSAELAAPIAKIAVRVGDVVDADTLVVRLDATLFELALQEQEARLRSLEARYTLAEFQAQRYTDLAKQNAISEELRRQRNTEATSLKAEVEAQRVAVQQARLMVNKCNVYAPFRAVVAERLASEGELAAPGTALLRLLDAERIELVAKVQSPDATVLTAVRSVTFEASGKQFPATLRVISEAYDSVERSREVRFNFAGAKPLPGAAGVVVWRAATPFVEPDVVVRRGDQLGLFVAEAGVARFVPLPDAQEGRPAAVDLPGDTQLILAGRYTVQHGDALAIGQ